jgi:hypothetical protein
VPRWARQGAGASRTERLPALYPLVCEGTKKEASPVRFAVTTDRPGRRSVGCLTSVEKITLGEAQTLAKEVHRGIAASVSAAKGGKPGAIIDDGTLTIGFVPPKEINLIEE